MAKKVVSFGIHKNIKKKPIKHDNNRTKKLKIIFKKILDYMKSDTYMFASLLLDPQSSLPSAFSSSGEPIRKREKKKLLENIGDYLTYDSYMYAPLAAQSVSHTEIPPIDRIVSKLYLIEDSGKGKAKTGTIYNHVESRTDETTVKDKDILKKSRDQIEVDGDDDDEIYAPTTPVIVKSKMLQRETIKRIVHQNCVSSSFEGNASPQKKQRKIVVE